MGTVCVPLHQHVGGVRGSVRTRALQVAQASPQRAGSRFPAAGSSQAPTDVAREVAGAGEGSHEAAAGQMSLGRGCG